MKYLLTFILSASFLNLYSQSSKAKELAAKMTTDEKVNFVVGMGMKFPGAPVSDQPTIGQTMDKVEGAAGTTFAISKLGIPNTVVADGPAGLRINPTRKDDKNTYYATAWPVATLLASTWDTKLVEKVGEAMGNEVKEYGVDVILGPGMNIQRDPLGGRNFEYYSEDPIVAGKMAAAMVNGIQSNGVGTSIKHFAANNQERNRNTVNAIISERALREIYLRGFEITVKESKPWTVMSSYNKINGTYTSESYDLLTTILRKEWGFIGIVMSDWFGGKDPVGQMKAGNDLLMPGTDAQKKLIAAALSDGSLDIKVLDENVARLLDYVLGTPSYKKYSFSNKPDLKAHAVIARSAAADGMVLLKNEMSALPLTKNIKQIAAFGNTSYDFISGGTGSGDVNEEYTISLVQGLNNAGYKTTDDLQKAYTDYINDYKSKHPKKNFFEEFMNPTPSAPELTIEQDMLNKKAEESEIALITIGRNAGEGSDRKIENDFNLSVAEISLLNNVSAAFHAKNKKVIVVLNIGGIVETASWKDKADAILLTWQPGLEAGNAVADVLSGKINPSGKLTATFPVKYNDASSAKNFPGIEFPEQATNSMMGKQMPAEVTYEEGIFVGYRYYNTFNVKPAYEFGYGLSYTNFVYSNLKLSSSSFNGKITATIDIKNTGKVAGKEVVQLYVTAPSGELEMPSIELKAFGKTNLLQPGQSQKLSFELSAKDIASFDTGLSSWITAAGNYMVKVGSSSQTILQSASFSVPKELIVEKCNKVLVPQISINELKK